MDSAGLRTRKPSSLAMMSISVIGSLLIALLTENGIDHMAAIRRGPDGQGLFAYLNDLLYLPAALFSIATICLFMEKRVRLITFELVGVLVTAALVAWFGHLL